MEESKFSIGFRNNFEMIFILVISIILSIILFGYRTEYTSLYFKSMINDTLIQLLGGLLGLLLTSYAILFGLIPNLSKDLLQSNHFLRINRYFLISILSIFLSLVLCIFFNFVEPSQTIEILSVLHFFFLSVSMLLILILSIILFLLFQDVRNKLIGS